jgi:hypothetical protein
MKDRAQLTCQPRLQAEHRRLASQEKPAKSNEEEEHGGHDQRRAKSDCDQATSSTHGKHPGADNEQRGQLIHNFLAQYALTPTEHHGIVDELHRREQKAASKDRTLAR